MIIATPNHQSDGQITRRSIFIGVAASLLCAPAIVRAASLMPVRSLILPIVQSSRLSPLGEFYCRNYYHYLAFQLRTGLPMTTTVDYGIISVADARRDVAYARAQGWLPTLNPTILGFSSESGSNYNRAGDRGRY